MKKQQRQLLRHVVKQLAFATGVLLTTITQCAIAGSLGRDDYFTYSSTQITGVGVPIVDQTQGSTHDAGTTSQVSASVNDPYAKPPTMNFADVDSILPVSGAVNKNYYGSTFGSAGLGVGALREFGRLSWGDGTSKLGATTAYGDIISIAPGKPLDVSARVNGGFYALYERVPGSSTSCVPLIGFCFPSVPFESYLGLTLKITAQMGIWDYDSLSATPFDRFGLDPLAPHALDCASAILCTQTTIPINFFDETVFRGGDEEDIYLASTVLDQLVVPDFSISTGSGGKFYVGALLSVTAEPGSFVHMPGFDVDDSLSEDFGNNWYRYHCPGTIFVRFDGDGCVPIQNQPAIAFDMTRSLDLEFKGDATYISQSGVFLSGTDRASVPEPATLALLSLGFIGLQVSRRKRTN
jgi:hypothetical protein